MNDTDLALAALAAFSSSPHAVNATDVEFKVHGRGVYGYVYGYVHFTTPYSSTRCFVGYSTRRGLSSYVGQQLASQAKQDQPQWDELHGYPVEQEHYL
jgi:hypothetical protein